MYHLADVEVHLKNSQFGESLGKNAETPAIVSALHSSQLQLPVHLLG